MSEQEQKVCPDCGSDLHIQLKNEAGYAKFWFVCVAERDECGWRSRTFRGPRRDESEIDEIGYDRHTERFREEAYQKAEEITQEELE